MTFVQTLKLLRMLRLQKDWAVAGIVVAWFLPFREPLRSRQTLRAAWLEKRRDSIA